MYVIFKGTRSLGDPPTNPSVWMGAKEVWVNFRRGHAPDVLFRL